MNYRNHFTSRAIKAIEFAQYAARELEQDYIGTERAVSPSQRCRLPD